MAAKSSQCRKHWNTHWIYSILELSAYFYLLLEICNLPYCSISLCVSNAAIVRISTTAAWSNLKTQPAPQMLHISGSRLPQTFAKQARQRDNMKGKTFLLPLLLTSLISKKPWEGGSGDSDVLWRWEAGAWIWECHCGAGHTWCSLSCTQNLGTSLFKMIFIKSWPEIAEGSRPTSNKGPETDITFSRRLTQEFNCKYALPVGTVVGLF